MSDQTGQNNVAETVRDIMQETSLTQRLDVNNKVENLPFLVSVPQGRAILDQSAAVIAAAELERPLRRKGTAQLATLASLIDWANRFKGETSALYADPKQAAPSLTCISNYHAAGEGDPEHCDHRGTYAFPLSKEWKKWTAISGKPMTKDEFSEFVEANAKDILDPTPAILGMKTDKADPADARMIETATKLMGRFGTAHQMINTGREFEVYETSDLKIKRNPDTGEVTVAHSDEHKDASGRPLKIPSLYMIAIPVFESGDPYRLLLRFSYRKRGGGLTFALTVYEQEAALDAAFQEAADKAAAETELPLFMGQPE